MEIKKALSNRIGMALIILSVPLWFFPFLAPFLPFTTSMKITFGTAGLIAGEVVFWIGVLLVGKEAAMQIRKRLTPSNWRKKEKDDLES